MTKQKYTVRILDNFHFMDKSVEYNSGTFDTYEEAVSKCKEILDDFLESAYQSGDTAEQLYGTYVQYGETPLIWGEKLGSFDSNDYARMRCTEISEQHQPKMKKLVFMIKPLPGETKAQFKLRLKRLLKLKGAKR